MIQTSGQFKNKIVLAQKSKAIFSSIGKIADFPIPEQNEISVSFLKEKFMLWDRYCFSFVFSKINTNKRN